MSPEPTKRAATSSTQLSCASFSYRRPTVRACARGLNDEVIKREQFRSTPTRDEADRITRRLAQDFDLTGVAGFYREHGTPRLVWTDTGIIIPARDQHARISALMYRRTHAQR
jgi:hypothetical protein